MRYAENGAGGLGWQATVMSGVVAIHFPATSWAYHAYEFSRRYVGVEFSQAQLGDPISDEAVDAFVWYAVNEVFPIWPQMPSFCINHSELPDQGGKSDAFPAGPEARAFAERVMARLREVR